MGFYAFPYRISCEDLNRDGSLHYLLNFRFQCMAREALLFGNSIQWKDAEKDVHFLTQQGYMRNFSSPTVGKKIVVLLTYEEPTVSTFRFCFRVLDEDGRPVNAGFQTLVCVDAAGKGLVSIPTPFGKHEGILVEQQQNPSFADLLITSEKSDALFSPHVCKAAKEFCAQAQTNFVPTLIENSSSMDSQTPAASISDFKSPVKFLSPVLIEERLSPTQSFQMQGNIVCLVDDELDALLAKKHLFETQGQVTFLSPRKMSLAFVKHVDVSSESSLAATLALPAATQTLVLLKSLKFDTKSEVLQNCYEGLDLLRLFFAASRALYEPLKTKTARAMSAFFEVREATPHPYAGMFGGYVKALARELPGAFLKCVSFEESLNASTELLKSELSADPTNPISADIFYIQAERKVQRLVPATRADDPRKNHFKPITKDSIVLATGAGRGVTAALAEQLMRDTGCTVIAIGKTDPKQCPAEILAMSEVEFVEFEGPFYAQQVAKSPSKKISEMKAEYGRLQAAHEIAHIKTTLSQFGNFEYHSLDLMNAGSVTQFVSDIKRRYGKIDVLIHGAGVQSSQLLPKKTLSDFSQVVSTKLTGLLNLQLACQELLPAQPQSTHVLTSAFSFWGNDGQVDYGAANESLNRICAQKADQQLNWTALAWPGWAGVGMTRGTAYTTMAKQRGFWLVTRAEGKNIFSHFQKSYSNNAVTLLASEGELSYFKVPNGEVERK